MQLFIQIIHTQKKNNLNYQKLLISCLQVKKSGRDGRFLEHLRTLELLLAIKIKKEKLQSLLLATLQKPKQHFHLIINVFEFVRQIIRYHGVGIVHQYKSLSQIVVNKINNGSNKVKSAGMQLIKLLWECFGKNLDFCIKQLNHKQQNEMYYFISDKQKTQNQANTRIQKITNEISDVTMSRHRQKSIKPQRGGRLVQRRY